MFSWDCIATLWKHAHGFEREVGKDEHAHDNAVDAEGGEVVLLDVAHEELDRDDRHDECGAGHRAAVKNDCPTIAVMGVPIDRTYPAANAALRQKIEQKGCVISEYPPYSEYIGPTCFLQRNRLIAALSTAVLVVEAREKSGTMSTVAHAERYGKPVYAVPGSIYSPNSAGTNGLLRDGRARAVAGAADLLAALGLHTRQAAPAAAKQPAPLSDTERRVLAGIGPKPVGIEELCVSTGLPMSALLGTLMKLELTGRVYKQPGQRYVLR